MALRTEYGLINSEFNEFLFAPVGQEENGMEMSVLSALTRLGVDPWAEAARLAGLPRRRAAPDLARMLLRVTVSRPRAADGGELALALVHLLPDGDDRPAPPRKGRGGGRKTHPSRLTTATWVVALAVAALILLAQ
jgi:hypothetical protein